METKRNLISFITGASRGIGFHIAKRLSHSCGTMLLTSKNEDTMSKAIEILQKESSSALYRMSIDLSSGNEAAKKLSEWARSITQKIDIVVLNAGFYIEGDLAEFSEENFRKNLEVNFMVNHFLVQGLLPLLKKADYPRIIITGSTAAYEPYPMVPTYGVAKWALRGYAINLRKELMNEGIGVTFISPGATLTDMWEGEELPDNRLLDPDDIAKLVESTIHLSKQAVVEEIIIRSMLGDMHE